MKVKKKYAVGGKVTPGPASKTTKPEWVGKGRSPQDPKAKGAITGAEELERLTWQKAIEALDRRGVSMVDQSNRSKKVLGQGNVNVVDANYELALKKAKEYGLYNQARQEAVEEYRSKARGKSAK